MLAETAKNYQYYIIIQIKNECLNNVAWNQC